MRKARFHRIDRLLRRLAPREYKGLLRDRPGLINRLRVVAHIGLRFKWFYATLLIVGLTTSATLGMDVYHRTEVPEFCASCHEMGDNIGSWEVSRHVSILCVDCHANPGLGGWVEAKIGGLRQLVKHFSAEKIEDITVDDHQRETVSENCKRCHIGAARINERRGLVFAHDKHAKTEALCVECHSRRFVHPGASKETKLSSLIERDRCFHCHDGKKKFKNLVAFSAADKKSCIKCHPDTGHSLAHGGDEHECSSCHVAEKKGHFTVDRKKPAKICSECHEFEEEYKSAHSAFTKGKCLDCHRIKSPAHLYLVASKPSADACLSCHSSLRTIFEVSGSKLVSSFSDDDQDLHKEHLDNIGEAGNWCKKCHGAHGSTKGPLLVDIPKTEDGEMTFSKTKVGGSCSGGCHEDGAEYSRKAGGGS
jgi:predicted CXXCH cytochrome family protein